MIVHPALININNGLDCLSENFTPLTADFWGLQYEDYNNCIF